MMTWQQLKTAIDAAGVKDEDQIDLIDLASRDLDESPLDVRRSHTDSVIIS